MSHTHTYLNILQLHHLKVKFIDVRRRLRFNVFDINKLQLDNVFYYLLSQRFTSLISVKNVVILPMKCEVHCTTNFNKHFIFSNNMDKRLFCWSLLVLLWTEYMNYKILPYCGYKYSERIYKEVIISIGKWTLLEFQ